MRKGIIQTRGYDPNISGGELSLKIASYPERASEPLNLRDDMLPWIREIGDFDVRAFDIQGEVLDLGTPATIQYGQENWRRYASNPAS